MAARRVEKANLQVFDPAMYFIRLNGVPRRNEGTLYGTLFCIDAPPSGRFRRVWAPFPVPGAVRGDPAAIISTRISIFSAPRFPSIRIPSNSCPRARRPRPGRQEVNATDRGGAFERRARSPGRTGRDRIGVSCVREGGCLQAAAASAGGRAAWCSRRPSRKLVMSARVPPKPWRRRMRQ